MIAVEQYVKRAMYWAARERIKNPRTRRGVGASVCGDSSEAACLMGKTTGSDYNVPHHTIRCTLDLLPTVEALAVTKGQGWPVLRPQLWAFRPSRLPLQGLG
jgi:hypothetical protein